MNEGFQQDNNNEEEHLPPIGGDVYMHQAPSIEISKHEVVPGFIKEFSRGHSQEERDALALEIRESRRNRDELRTEQSELGESKEKLIQDLDALKETIEKYNDASFLNKITDYFEYKKTKVEIDKLTRTLAGTESRLGKTEEEIPQFQETKKLIDDFYEGERKKWAEAGHTPENIAKQFSEEHLASLSVGDYVTLMKRFPGEMVTHVTRQGIRDHTGIHEHTGGEGQFHDGFKSILAGGRLRSALGIALQEHGKEEAMAKFLKLDTIDDDLTKKHDLSAREIALTMNNLHIAGTAKFADKSAVHVAAESVADGIYGSERGNEIFFAYPAAYVASQLHYGGVGDLTFTDGAEWGSNQMNNDHWVYTQDHEGMPINAGLVFVPEDAEVNIETGSRYSLTENGEPIIPQKRIDEIFNARFENLGFVQTFVEKLSLQLEQFDEEEKARVTENAFQKFGITDPEAKKALLDPKFLKLVGKEWGKETERDEYKEIVGKYFEDHAENRYELAENTTSSREYWEQYFTEHPERRPSKIVYYKGGDPSRALNEWRRENGIIKRTKDETFGFPEHRVGSDSPEANQGKERFKELALKVIDDRFPEVPDPEEEESV